MGAAAGSDRFEKAAFFGADMHMFRIAGFRPGRRVITEPVKPADGARLDVWQTDPGDRRPVPAPGSGDQLLCRRRPRRPASGDRDVRRPPSRPGPEEARPGRPPPARPVGGRPGRGGKRPAARARRHALAWPAGQARALPPARRASPRPRPAGSLQLPDPAARSLQLPAPTVAGHDVRAGRPGLHRGHRRRRLLPAAGLVHARDPPGGRPAPARRRRMPLPALAGHHQRRTNELLARGAGRECDAHGRAPGAVTGRGRRGAGRARARGPGAGARRGTGGRKRTGAGPGGRTDRRRRRAGWASRSCRAVRRPPGW